MHKAIGIGLFAVGATMLSAAELDLLNSGPLQGKLPYLWSGPVGNIATYPFRIWNQDANGAKNPTFDIGTDFGIRVGGYLAIAGLFLSLAEIQEATEWIILLAIAVGFALVIWSLYVG
jgi:hypothetical protein